MGRGGRTREQKPLPLEKPVPRKLSDEEYDRVAHQLAVKGHAIRIRKRELSNETREARKDIKQLEAERATLEDMLISHEQLLPQRDLTFSKPEAATAIAAVATVAGDAPPQAAPAAHTFVPDKKGEGTCWACGKPKDDAMHGAASPPADCGDQPSKLEGLTNREAVGLVADVINQIAPVAGEVLRSGAEEVLSKPPEDPVVHTGVDLGSQPDETVWSPHPYKHVRQAPGVCGVCGVKKRAHPPAPPSEASAGAAPPRPIPSEPHAFFGTAAGPDCRICGSGPNDPVHTSAEGAAGGVRTPPPTDPTYDFGDDEPRPKVIASHPLQPESGS